MDNRDAFLRKERDRLRAYRRTAKGKAALLRYARSPAGKAARQRYNRKRIFIAHEYYSVAKTEAQAHEIRAYVRSRLHAFIAGLKKRAQMETLATDAVSVQAGHRAD